MHLIGSLEIIRQISVNEGIAGFYVGSGGMLLREIPFNSLQMAFYASLKEISDKSHFLDNILQPDSTSFSSGSLDSAILGFVASFFAAILTQPADVIKTRLMAERKPLINENGEQYRSNVYNEFLDIINSEGVTGLFKGIKPRILLCTIGGLIYFFIADLTSTSFNLIVK